MMGVRFVTAQSTKTHALCNDMSEWRLRWVSDGCQMGVRWHQEKGQRVPHIVDTAGGEALEVF